MQVRVLPNQRRPGVGKPPARDNRRAWLPQQARFCPVLEDASRSGYLLYAPLHEHEAYQVHLSEKNVLQLTFFVPDATGANRVPAFSVEIRPSGGTGGLDQTEIVYLDQRAQVTPDLVSELLDALLTNVNGPPGGIGLRAAFDFVTPPGWDTIYTGVLNEPQQPLVPVLTARIETDWYAQSTEFRYLLQRGDTVSVSAGAPIGQVLFVPRENVDLVPGSEGDVSAFNEAQQTYWEARLQKDRHTNYGATYSYHYRDLQKTRRTEERD